MSRCHALARQGQRLLRDEHTPGVANRVSVCAHQPELTVVGATANDVIPRPTNSLTGRKRTSSAMSGVMSRIDTTPNSDAGHSDTSARTFSR